MRELEFHLAEAIRSDQPGAIAKFKETQEGHIRAAEDGIKRLCKKNFLNFIDAHDQMERFKDSLRHVRTDLGQI